VTLNKKQLQLLRCIANDLGVRVISYSGRFMYGKKCLAVDGDFSPFALGFAIGQREELSEFEQVLDSTKQDQMGLGIVLYWPRIEAPSSEEDEGGDVEDECEDDECEDDE
jgi:hypothetical protein